LGPVRWRSCGGRGERRSDWTRSETRSRETARWPNKGESRSRESALPLAKSSHVLPSKSDISDTGSTPPRLLWPLVPSSRLRDLALFRLWFSAPSLSHVVTSPCGQALGCPTPSCPGCLYPHRGDSHAVAATTPCPNGRDTAPGDSAAARWACDRCGVTLDAGVAQLLEERLTAARRERESLSDLLVAIDNVSWAEGRQSGRPNSPSPTSPYSAHPHLRRHSTSGVGKLLLCAAQAGEK